LVLSSSALEQLVWNEIVATKLIRPFEIPGPAVVINNPDMALAVVPDSPQMEVLKNLLVNCLPPMSPPPTAGIYFNSIHLFTSLSP